MSDPITATWLLGAFGALSGGVVGGLAGRALRARPKAVGPSARDLGEREKADARLAREALLREAEVAAREEALGMKSAAEAAVHREEERLARLGNQLVEREVNQAARAREAEEARARLTERAVPLAAHDGERDRHRKATSEAVKAARAMLEQVAGERAESLRRALAEAEIEQARAAGVQLVRHTAENVADAEIGRRAKRLLGIAVGRFEGHYLTERHHSLIALGPAKNGQPAIAEPELHAIETVSGIKLTLNETVDAVRLEGLDGVGREVARRCLARLLKRPLSGGEAAVLRMAKEVSSELDREVMDLGRRAFSVLEVERAHPDIVRLVGRLNWRTSFTQNQWKHAVEVGFLCGLMADELGLEPRVARRAALMHDIGKALTHELDGSHAVIGADYARRLGESELVANAIGAHHTDEPFSSPYAYLVAAADAMSGARPGARRQTEDNYTAKIADLERLSRGFPGVAEAFAVQGGREVRVMVRDDVVDDLGAVKLSGTIAEAISREMTFPGQIRVTVIREFRAVERAGG